MHFAARYADKRGGGSTCWNLNRKGGIIDAVWVLLCQHKQTPGRGPKLPVMSLSLRYTFQGLPPGATAFPGAKPVAGNVASIHKRAICSSTHGLAHIITANPWNSIKCAQVGRAFEYRRSLHIGSQQRIPRNQPAALNWWHQAQYTDLQCLFRHSYFQQPMREKIRSQDLAENDRHSHQDTSSQPASTASGCSCIGWLAPAAWRH